MRLSDPNFSSKHVVLVDDDPLVLSALERQIKRLGCQTVSFNDPLHALTEKGNDSSVHLLITDMHMPAMTGRALAQQMQIRNPTLRVIYVSGCQPDSLAEQRLLNPFDHFLMKPFSFELLKTVLLDIFG